VDGDGVAELIIANESQNAAFAWSSTEQSWKRLLYSLPSGVAIVNAQGQDNGVRFVDLNEDGIDDLVLSNQEGYSVSLMVPTPAPGFQPGWSREIMRVKRGEPGAIPMIARGGTNPNNGVWFRAKQMWVHNEETTLLPGRVDRRSFAQLLTIRPPSIDVVNLQGGQIGLRFQALAGQTYVVESRTSISSGGWVTLTNVAAPAVTGIITVTSDDTGSEQFYRVRTP
jgi:hypothetical protein